MGYFFPTPRKGKLGRRRVQRADTRPSGLDSALSFYPFEGWGKNSHHHLRSSLGPPVERAERYKPPHQDLCSHGAVLSWSVLPWSSAMATF
jgi:hypothetical protein